MRYLITLVFLLTFFTVAIAQGDTVDPQPPDDLDAIASVPVVEEDTEPTGTENLINTLLTVLTGIFTVTMLLGARNVLDNGFILAGAILIVKLAWLTPYAGDDTLARNLINKMGGEIVETDQGPIVVKTTTVTTADQIAAG